MERGWSLSSVNRCHQVHQLRPHAGVTCSGFACLLTKMQQHAAVRGSRALWGHSPQVLKTTEQALTNNSSTKMHVPTQKPARNSKNKHQADKPARPGGSALHGRNSFKSLHFWLYICRQEGFFFPQKQNTCKWLSTKSTDSFRMSQLPSHN